MRIVFSRKGFDSANGGMPSPIMPDGTLLPLPIPCETDVVLYSELFHSGKSYFDIIKELNENSYIKKHNKCHLDPDINKDVKIRNGKWLPLFGQAEAAAGHLMNKKVGKGELFLFFGWYMQSEFVNGQIKFVKGAPDLHLIYGYMQVKDIYIGTKGFPEEFSYHPHYKRGLTNNCIYEAADKLDIMTGYRGHGVFKFDKKLVLTKSGESRSKWNLPGFFKDVKISYHSEKSWKGDYFQSATRGQEFVLEANEKILEWVKGIIKAGTDI